ncbi:MAG: prepilin peptidase [Acidobacteria bacterium]|nr:prepilin peptidase [Acidobacteriota bacterium]
MTTPTLDLLFVSVFGLVVGSYLNVVVYRLPRGRSTVAGRSGCPFCGSLIRWWNNLPLLSFLWLKGRCRDCRSPIFWRYPLLELLTALGFALSYRSFGPGWAWVLAALFLCILLLLAFIDLEHLILPDRLTLAGAALGFVLFRWLPWRGSLVDHLVGAALGPALLLGLYGLWFLIRRAEGLGLGDVKMMILVGAFLGWRGSLMTLFLGTLTAMAVALWLMATGRMGLKNKIPFGPFLSLGAAVALFATGSGWLDRFLPPLPWG